MPATGSISLFYPGSFSSFATGFTLFATGSAGLVSGTLPLNLYAKEMASGTVSLYLAAYARPGVWESLGSPWQSYDTSCDVTASTFCQDWEYIPYTTASTSGTTNRLTMFMSGKYRGDVSGSMPMFIQNSGEGIKDSYLSIFMYAEGNEILSSGNITAFLAGHQNINSNITAYVSGAMPSVTGCLDMFCSGLGYIDNYFKLFINGKA